MFTTGEAAKLLGVTAQTIVNWVDSGRLPALRFGDRSRRRIGHGTLWKFVTENGIPAATNAPDLWERLASNAPRIPQELPATIAIDKQGVVVFWSRGLEILLGWNASERIGRPVGEQSARVPGLPVDLADLARDSGDELRLSLGLELLHREGRYVPTETTISWIRDSRGEVVGAVFVLEPSPGKSSSVVEARRPRRGRPPKS
ncbi:MAG: excisionase family DNA-binding protein [Fibrobacteria bacterium]|nr:excisionase family DNA-binding protein [Fibrobacteria bacterium]